MEKAFGIINTMTMQTLILFLPILLAGILSSKYFLKDAQALERLGSFVFFTLASVPFLVINLALIFGTYVTKGLILWACLFAIVLFGLLIFLRDRKKGFKENDGCALNLKEDLPALIVLIFVSVFSFLYYSNSEFILSLGSYLIKGDASCFSMQTFKTSPLINPDTAGIMLRHKFYDIICTPGNTLFTASLLPIFKMGTFRIAYMSFAGLLFVFTYLLSRCLVGNKGIALLVAAFSVLNPYLLSVEVLDRNVMALAISAFMFYLLVAHKDKPLFHGLVFGILSGTGLRFLPLLFSLPVFLLYYRQRKRAKGYFTFIAGFWITFTFNIPHLYFNGFRSLGETSSSANLIAEAYTSWMRTPFLPLPNIFFYLADILNFWGYLACGIMLFGTFSLIRKDRFFFLVSLAMFLPALLVLSYQRNWIEGAKYRIIIEAFLPLYIFLACGLKSLFVKNYSVKKSVLFFVSILLPIVFARLLSMADFKPDNEFYQRRCLYQRETQEYHLLAKNFLLRAGIFPNYARLCHKSDIKRKRTDEKLTFRNLFLRGELPNTRKFNLFYANWKEYFLSPKCPYVTLPPARSAPEQNYAYLEVDFAKLAKEPRLAIKVLKGTDIASIDLGKEEELFDVYYAALSVPWQEHSLPACILLNADAIKYLKELNIELNAFISFGKDDAGFDIINSINFQTNPALSESALRTGMRSFPLYAEANKIVFRVPEDLEITIKNWMINGENGTPYKLDSWRIKKGRSGKYRVSFFYNEPESYL